MPPFFFSVRRHLHKKYFPSPNIFPRFLLFRNNIFLISLFLGKIKRFFKYLPLFPYPIILSSDKIPCPKFSFFLSPNIFFLSLLLFLTPTHPVKNRDTLRSKIKQNLDSFLDLVLLRYGLLRYISLNASNTYITLEYHS